MGREEKRLRDRTMKQLAKRLHRQPTDEELERELAGLRRTQELASLQKRKP